MSHSEASNSPSSQPYRSIDRVLPQERQAQGGNDLLCLPLDFTQAAFHTAIQTPINSLTQMVAPDCLPQMQIIDAPESVSELSPRWHAQQFGSALGAAADIAAIEFVTDGSMPPALVGACYDGLLRPVDEDKTKNQLTERAKNALIGACGFTVMYGANKAFGVLENKIENATWKSLAGNKVVTGTLSGIPSGLLTTALSGGSTAHDFGLGTYTSAIGGMGLGAVHAAAERQAVRQSQTVELAKFREAAVTDHVTGLANRRGCDQALQTEFDRSTRSGKPISLIYGDLDGFKKVNDNLGHEAGDRVLVEVGRRLKQHLRTYDHACRSGGDEFTLILPETDEGAAAHVARRLERAIRIAVGKEGNRHQVGISLGVVTRQAGDNCVADLQKRADTEMYRVKKERKGSI